jgi:nitroimidazol reductase NimA-like FMN-containing flavoprotein (pyridoxamine 5'-phosphate oxidase superfamily)
MIGTLSHESAKEILRSNIIGRIGCNDGKRTYVVPIQYVFDGKDIYAHSVEGMKIHMMRKNPEVCFEVDEIQNLNNWKSVIAWGRYQELKEEHDRYAAIKLFVDRNIHLKISETAMLPAISVEKEFPFQPLNIRPIIYRLIIEEITGRFENFLKVSTGN